LIYNNAGDGIDLGPNDGPTPNDVNDVDIGPNDLLNTPVFTSAFLSGATLILSGFMNTQANKDLVIQLYANPSGGQGQIQLGFIPVSMGPNNTVFFTKTLTVPSTVVKGYTLTAIAIDQLGNSSEFSIPLVIE
ncbi:MAG TPA: hypothetical protein VFE62_00935, partial [Gemmataceae bacterium]|nr:hypothetical protein [Gemmataceae bacterium]